MRAIHLADFLLEAVQYGKKRPAHEAERFFMHIFRRLVDNRGKSRKEMVQVLKKNKSKQKDLNSVFEALSRSSDFINELSSSGGFLYRISFFVL